MEEKSLQFVTDSSASPQGLHHQQTTDIASNSSPVASPKTSPSPIAQKDTSTNTVRVSGLIEEYFQEEDGTRKTSLPPIHETTSAKFSEEDLNCIPVAPQTRKLRHFSQSKPERGRKRSNAIHSGVSLLGVLDEFNLSESVEEIANAPRKEVSNTVIQAETKIKRDSSFRIFALEMTHSTFFNRMMLFIVLVNTVVIAFQHETEQNHPEIQEMFWMLNDIFTASYTMEFLVKLYADRSRYWFSVYNLFDFAILMIAYIDLALDLTSAGHDKKLSSLMRSFRAFRALKIVNFLPGVQMIASALVQTLKQLIRDVVLLLLLLLFTFGVMGFYSFGYDAVTESVIESWGSLSAVFLSLFTVVTADSWWKFIEQLVDDGGYSIAMSRTYIITFLFFGHFITANLFIAVIIMNIQSSSNNFKIMSLREKEIVVEERKKQYWKRSRREVKRMMSNANLEGESNFTRIASEFYYAIQKRDFIVMSDLKTNILWLDTVSRELNRSVKSCRRSIYIHRELLMQVGPICNLSELDTRKTSISRHHRYVVKHKLGALQLLHTSNTAGQGQSLTAPRMSIYHRKSSVFR